MARTLDVAAVQMDANSAATTERLARAEKLVVGAAQAGARLVVLPELFNTGYTYSDENHVRAERSDGPTATWMCDTATRLGVHLAGTLMLLERGDIYNSLLFFAPDGRVWRYDKNYPWGWERGYFRGPHGGPRGGPRTVVAETDLGDLGLLICWDLAHLKLWQQYAGRVDMMVICSCPPDVGDSAFCFPDGARFAFEDLEPLAAFKEKAREIFGPMLNQQTAWLGVPAVHTVGSGSIRTDLPSGRLSMLTFGLSVPRLLKHLPHADRVQLACNMTPSTKVVGAGGEVLAELAQQQGEAFTLARVHLSERKPSPQGPQPKSVVPGLVYFLFDIWFPALTKPVYRRHLRQILGT